jgi:hypothetical protein
MTLARYLLPKDISREAMTPFIPQAHKGEDPCNINLFVSFIQSSSIPLRRKRLDRSVLPQSIQELV